MPLLFYFAKDMIDFFQDILLFDCAKERFVKKSELSDDSKKLYNDLSIAHLKMMKERYKKLKSK